MNRIKRLYEFQCQKTGERWYKEDEKVMCPVKGDCVEEIEQIGYLIVEVIHYSAAIKKVEGQL